MNTQENWITFKAHDWIQNGRNETRKLGTTIWTISDHGRVFRNYWNAEGQKVKSIEVHQHWKGRTKKYLAIPTGEYVHRLVAQYFIPNPEGHKIVVFQDEDLTNTKASNLMWRSSQGLRTGYILGPRKKNRYFIKQK